MGFCFKGPMTNALIFTVGLSVAASSPRGKCVLGAMGLQMAAVAPRSAVFSLCQSTDKWGKKPYVFHLYCIYLVTFSMLATTLAALYPLYNFQL